MPGATKGESLCVCVCAACPLCACRVLELLPCPLPGFETPQQLQPLLLWAVELQHSPRVRESDAGALTLRLLAVKYLIGLHWTLRVLPNISVSAAGVNTHTTSSGRQVSACTETLVAAAAAFLSSLTGQLRARVVLAQQDMAAASRAGLAHGLLLSLRYCVEVLPWPALAGSRCHVSITASNTAAAAAAAGVAAQLQAVPAGGSITTAEGSAGGQQEDGGGNRVVTVTGPAWAVLHCWIADLIRLLEQVTEVVSPLLCAQVSRCDWDQHMWHARGLALC